MKKYLFAYDSILGIGTKVIEAKNQKQAIELFKQAINCKFIAITLIEE